MELLSVENVTIILELWSVRNRMSNTFYGGIPVEQVDFEKEFEKELEQLTDHINQLKAKKDTGKKINYQYWTLKLNRANRALEVGTITLD